MWDAESRLLAYLGGLTSGSDSPLSFRNEA